MHEITSGFQKKISLFKFFSNSVKMNEYLTRILPILCSCLYYPQPLICGVSLCVLVLPMGHGCGNSYYTVSTVSTRTYRDTLLDLPLLGYVC